ncbi:MAG: hypothetical protein NTU62_16265 [Spirochaetes bacterium]|nr:hypothetical protein [Spirochaetota bacterium]
MIGHYALGVGAALCAGAAYNVGQLAQKIAVNRLPAQEGAAGRLRSSLFVRLLGSPVWLAGFAVVVLVGTPLNLVAALWLGPAILPGLMSLGLVVLAVGAVTVAGEQLGAVDVAGIALVIAGIVLIGLSRLLVDVSSTGMREPALLASLVAFTLCSSALGAVLLTVAPRMHGACGPLRAVAAGLFFSGGNLWLAEVMHSLNHWLAGAPIRDGLGLAAVALAVILASSLLGVVVTQHAYRVGNASRLVPIQMVPQQIVPILAFLLVFRTAPPSASALPLAAAGTALILGGAGLLAGRQATTGTS